ncbi:MAG: aspartyl/glutamyl-tRNA amidotransferase subunit A [Desulfobulbaceae bacterium A2]|nr:MAG: aspartyl/glutamyl-tRNA amidotransferase subunit A [Desulfobulbaceae bacterium A2]
MSPASPTDPALLTIHEAQALLADGALSAVELVEALARRVEALEPRVHCYITRALDQARQQALEADRMRSRGEGGSLCGVPFAIKDCLCTEGMRTTCGSRMLETFIPPYDATVIARLRSQGAVFLGKLAMDEFAMGSTSETCAYTVPDNPWRAGYVCGGSSGGSAAALAADLCLGTLGSDTGGSIRQPASLCGVAGLKPTYGRVSRYGLVAFASSLDQVGPLGKDIRDCALVLGAIAGHDPRDSTSAPQPVPDYLATLGEGVRGLRVGVPREYFAAGLDPEVDRLVRAGIEALVRAGAETVDISLPHTEYCVAAYYLIAPAEASSNLARYDGVRYGFRAQNTGSLDDMFRQTRSQGFGDEVKRRILIGTYALSSGYYDAYYKKASQVRSLILRDYLQAFERCDLIASPVVPMTAWPLGGFQGDPLALYLSDILTISANLAGVPALSVPAGLSEAGLPVGLQLQAPHFREDLLLRAGLQVEEAMGGRTRPQL